MRDNPLHGLGSACEGREAVFPSLDNQPYGELETSDCVGLEGEEATTDHLFDLSNQEWGELSCTEPPLPPGEPCDSLLQILKQSEREADSVLTAEICQRIENEEKIGRVQLEKFTVEHAHWLILNDCLCIYDQCYWRRLHNKNEAVVAIRKVLRDHPSLYRTLTNSDYSNLCALLKTNPKIPHLEVLPRHRGQINFFDGVLDLDSKEVLPHEPEQYFSSYVNCSAYDVLFPPTNGEVFEAFVERAGNGDPDVREQLLEQVLMAFAELDLKYFGYLVGPSHTGKSQFGAWLEASLGSENIQVLRDINDFSDKWTPGSLDGKNSSHVGMFPMP